MRRFACIYLVTLVPLVVLCLPSPSRSADAPSDAVFEDNSEWIRRLSAAEQQIATLHAQVTDLRAVADTPPASETPQVEPDLVATKKQVLGWIEEKKKNTFPSVTLNGVFQADGGFFQQDDTSVLAHGRIQDGADFRRARLSAKGSVTPTVAYFMQMDFAFFGHPTFTDVWVEQKELPGIGNLRIGQWKQPFSLEVVSSFRYTTFMERAVIFQPFTPFRHLGAGIYDHSQDLSWTWAASGFRTGQDQFGGSVSTSGGWGTAERITHLFYWDDSTKGRYYLHGGLGHFFSNPPHNTFNFRTIPELYLGEVGNDPWVGTSGQPTPGPNNGTPFFVQTGPLQLNHYNVIGTELLWVNGPLSVQSEAMVNYVDRTNGDTAALPGFYAQVGYFMTGEHRPYDRAAGAIDRVTPFTNFFAVNSSHGYCSGPGAWEIAARISHIDLNDDTVRGGTLTNLTAGVNWYWNPYTKMVFNYIHAWNDSTLVNPATAQEFGPNETDMYAVRVQVDF
jgi:phosphate-selective porin OprO and OprP